MERVANAIVACCRRYRVSSSNGSCVVADFYRAPESPQELLTAVAGFPEEEVLGSGLFYADPLAPVIESDSEFMVLRGNRNELIDVIYETVLVGAAYRACRCASGQLPLLRLFADEVFRNCQGSEGTVCLVNSLKEAALLRISRIRACPASCLLTAHAQDLRAVLNQFSLFEDATTQQSARPKLVLADWRIDQSLQGVPAYLEDTLVVFDRIAALAKNALNAVGLWRPESKNLRMIAVARAHNLNWWVHCIQASFASNRRSLDKRNRPLDGDPAMLAYHMQCLDAIAQQPDHSNLGLNGSAWHTAHQHYQFALSRTLLNYGLIGAGSNAADTAQTMKALLDQHAMLQQVPSVILDMGKWSAADPAKLAQMINSPALRRLMEAADTAAESERALQAWRNR